MKTNNIKLCSNCSCPSMCASLGCAANMVAKARGVPLYNQKVVKVKKNIKRVTPVTKAELFGK